MSDTEMKIKSCFFGGYNKKCTDAYIKELRQTIENLQIDLQAVNETNKNKGKRIKELEKSYQELQESGREQARQIEQQENEIRVNEKVIQAHKETIRTRGDIIRRQEEELQNKKEELQDQKEEIRHGQEAITELELKLEVWDGRYKELEARLGQKEKAAEEDRAQILELEDQLEKYQWMYEEFFRDREWFPGSKLEKYIQKSISRRAKSAKKARQK